MITYGRHLSEIHIKRAGVIPYCIHGNIIMLCLGIDKKHREYTDWGGGVKKSETALEGALREFREETKSIFPDRVYCINGQECSPVLLDDEMAVMLIKISIDVMLRSQSVFLETEPKARCERENVDLVWVTSDVFYKLIWGVQKGRKLKMWDRLRSFYKKFNFADVFELIKAAN